MDQERWDSRYSGSEVRTTISEPAIFRELGHHLPATGRAVDVAGGLGDGALWLAQRGLGSHLLDVSSVALDIAAQRAELLGLPLTPLHVDLSTDPMPNDRWDVLTCVHYFDRAFLRSVPSLLAPGGVALIAIATTTNLERHERPSARFLLDPEELPILLDGAVVLDYAEGWTDAGTHEARIAITTVSPLLGSGLNK